MRYVTCLLILFVFVMSPNVVDSGIPPVSTLEKAKRDYRENLANVMAKAMKLDSIIRSAETLSQDEIDSMSFEDILACDKDLFKRRSWKKSDVIRLIEFVSEKMDINPAFVKALVKAESHFNPKAVSHQGALGLMQVMPSTGAWLYPELDLENPYENLIAGIRYYKRVREQFNGYTRLALAAYNAGPNAVKRYGWKIPPYNETQNYVKKVYSFYYEYNRSTSV